MDIRKITQRMERWRIQRRRKIVADGLRDLHALTITVHGRFMLGEVINDQDNGLEPEIRRMYWILLQTAPVQEHARFN